MGSHQDPALPSQRTESPSQPIRIPSPPIRKQRAPRKPVRWLLLLVPLGVLLAAGGVAAFLFLVPGTIDNAKAGDCASFDRSNPQNPYATVNCGSGAAVFRVLQVINGDGDCHDVAGASRSALSTQGSLRREVCLGPKDVDPASAVNVAQVGDCLTGTTGEERRVPCDDPTATVKILARVDDVSNTQVPGTCDRVPGAVSLYSWTWDADDGTGPAQASYQTDAVFCLGPIR